MATKRLIANDEYLIVKMRDALIRYWSEQGFSYQDADLPTNHELLQMLIAVKPYLKHRTT